MDFLKKFKEIQAIETEAEPKDCIEAAELRKLPLSMLLKAILLEDKGNNHYLACILADKKLNLKKIAKIMGCKRLSFAPQNTVLEKTGCPPGAVAPYTDSYPLLWDKSVTSMNQVNISAGNKKISYNVSVPELHEITQPKILDFVEGG
ncbi:MAG: YbaK/EbsC family protein [Candidatus Diapherotrites archaeon]